jgi:hypothetical protein
MSDLTNSLLLDNCNILVARPTKDVVFTFSNSGKAGNRNWFSMTSAQLAASLEDILASEDPFPVCYNEKIWRGLFAANLTDDVARTMGAVQTLPLFEMLAKIVHFASNDGPRSYKAINLESTQIRHAIELLKLIHQLTVSSKTLFLNPSPINFSRVLIASSHCRSDGYLSGILEQVSIIPASRGERALN